MEHHTGIVNGLRAGRDSTATVRLPHMVERGRAAKFEDRVCRLDGWRGGFASEL